MRCEKRHSIPFQGSVVDVLCLLQYVGKRKGFLQYSGEFGSNFCLSCGFQRKTSRTASTGVSFMRSAHWKLHVAKPMIPFWDLLIVLEAVSHHPFKPTEGTGMMILSLKTALTTAKRVSDLHALSVHPPLVWGVGSRIHQGESPTKSREQNLKRLSCWCFVAGSWIIRHSSLCCLNFCRMHLVSLMQSGRGSHLP